MGAAAKGSNIIDVQLYDRSPEDRQDAIEFALHPANGVTAVLVYLHGVGIKASISTAHKWMNSLRDESKRVTLMRAVFADYKGVTPGEINAYLTATLAESIVKLNEIIDKDGLDSQKIQSLTSLAKEARSSAQAMNTPHSTASMKELELGHALAYSSRLEAIFEGDDVLLERVKNANKAIFSEIESSYT